MSVGRRWHPGPAALPDPPPGSNPSWDVQCPAGDGPILPGQWVRFQLPDAPGGSPISWHDDCAEDAGAPPW